jgi:hypothetical protein
VARAASVDHWRQGESEAQSNTAGTHSYFSDLLSLRQHVSKFSKEVIPIDVSRYHTQGVNIRPGTMNSQPVRSKGADLAPRFSCRGRRKAMVETCFVNESFHESVELAEYPDSVGKVKRRITFASIPDLLREMQRCLFAIRGASVSEVVRSLSRQSKPIHLVLFKIQSASPSKTVNPRVTSKMGACRTSSKPNARRLYIQRPTQKTWFYQPKSFLFPRFKLIPPFELFLQGLGEFEVERVGRCMRYGRGNAQVGLAVRHGCFRLPLPMGRYGQARKGWCAVGYTWW